MRTTSVFVDGHTKIRAVISFGVPSAASCTTFATVVTSSGLNQLMIAPSASRAARRNIPSRRAATRIGGCTSGRIPRRNPFTLKVSYSLVTFSPDNASFKKRTTSRTFLYGSSNGTPFHFSTITLLEEPTPITKRPGAASAIVATDCANSAGVRVNAGTMAVPKRRRGSHAAAMASGVNASAPSASADQISV